MGPRHTHSVQKTPKKFSCSFKFHPQSTQIMFELEKTKKSSKNKPVVIKMQKVEGIYYLGWSLNRAHSINKNIKLLGEKRYTQKTMGNLKAALTFTSKHLHIPLKRKESNLLIVSYILGISTTRSCSLLVS